MRKGIPLPLNPTAEETRSIPWKEYRADMPLVANVANVVKPDNFTIVEVPG